MEADLGIQVAQNPLGAATVIQNLRSLLRDVLMDMSVCDIPDTCECSTARAHRFLGKDSPLHD